MYTNKTNLKEREMSKHFANILTVVSLIYEVQLFRKILTRLLGQPAKLEPWK